MSTVPQQSKIQLRKYYKSLLAEITFSNQLKISKKICNILYGRFYGSRSKFILSFFKIPDQNEIDLFPLNQMLARNHQLVLPRVNTATNQLECYLVDNLETLVPQSPYQIYEPDPKKHKQVPAHMLDVILTPGLAFDTNFQRLGRGKGYYDRLIESCRKSTKDIEVIAVGHLVQLSEIPLPTEAHDQSMDELLLL
jgi:5-formyltetrahydrofolate cyclo-ligase